MNKYERQSFDRFGDDLCRELLRYLSLSDCLKFESVSAQFKRNLFNSQSKLDLNINRMSGMADTSQSLMGLTFVYDRRNYYYLSRTEFESVLNKCPNISHVCLKRRLIANRYYLEEKSNRFSERYVISDEHLFGIIGEKCRFLSAVQLEGLERDVSRNAWQLFGEKCGHSLRSITIYAWNPFDMSSDSLHLLFRLCQNLIECKTNLNVNTFIRDDNSDGDVFLPNIQKIEAHFNAETDFERFAEQYSDKVEEIDLREYLNKVEGVDDKFYECLLMEVSRFERLKVFDLQLIPSTEMCDKGFDRGLSSIAKRCRQLAVLSLNVCKSEDFFENMTEKFQYLKRLNLQRNYENDGYVDRLKCCPNLIHLTFGVLRNHYFLNNVSKYLPKLKAIRLFDNRITNSDLESMANLNDLYFIEIGVYGYSILTDLGLREFINRCANIRKIKTRMDISVQTLNAFIDRADSNPNQNYMLSGITVNDMVSVDDENVTTRTANNIYFDLKFEP